MANETFPIDLGKLQPLKLDPAVTTLTDAKRDRAIDRKIKIGPD